MFERHSDKQRYFKEQAYTTEKYVIPFIEKVMPVTPDTKVLEVGCAEGGNMWPFLDKGCKVTGLDIAEHRIELSKQFFNEHPKKENLRLVVEDIYKAEGKIDKDYDLIIMRDVIEHIPNQAKFLGFLKNFLKDSGLVFVAFPPWYNPFGGHQQMLKSKLLSRLPYFYLLPGFMYRGIMKAFGEDNQKIENMMDIKKTGISIDRFNRIAKKNGYDFKKIIYYFINPNYEVKFKLKPRVQTPIISSIPYLRNFFTTVGYYLLSKKQA